MDSTQPTDAKCNLISCLERIDVSGKHKPLYLTGSEVIIGRNNSASIPVFSPNISRSHAILRCTEEGWTIVNNKSLNGVYINKELLSPGLKHVLQENDVIHLGPPDLTEFQFRYFTSVPISGDDNYLKPCKIRNKEVEQVTNLQTECKEKFFPSSKTQHIYISKEAEADKSCSVYGAISPVNNSISETNPLHNTYHEDFRKPEEHVPVTVESIDLQEKLKEMQKLLAEKERSEQQLQIKLKEKEDELQKCHKENKEIACEVEQIKLQNKENSSVTIQEQELKKQLEIRMQDLLKEKKQVEEKMKNLTEKDKEIENVLQKEKEWLQTELARKESQTKQMESQLKNAEAKEEQTRLEIIKHFGELMETELICAICSELFIEATALNCSHTFCAQCISHWKKKKKDCPICRSKIKSETRALVMDNFIDKMVESLTPDLQSRRKAILEDRKGNKQNSKENCGSVNTRSEVSSSTVPIVDVGNEPIIITDSDLDTSDFTEDSDSSVEGDPFAYYGGYGYCFHCGRRGHWANGCPDRY